MHGDLPGRRGKSRADVSAKLEKIARDHSLGSGAVLLRATGQLRQSQRHRSAPCAAWAQRDHGGASPSCAPQTLRPRGSIGLTRGAKQAGLSTTAERLIRRSSLVSPVGLAWSGAELARVKPLLPLTAPVGGHGRVGSWPR
jgi:hypothetical protein